jgi:hypothetical protein
LDSTSAAPPSLASDDPATVTCTPEPVNRPASVPSAEAMLLGSVGDPPQALKNVASVAPEAT